MSILGSLAASAVAVIAIVVSWSAPARAQTAPPTPVPAGSLVPGMQMGSPVPAASSMPGMRMLGMSMVMNSAGVMQMRGMANSPIDMMQMSPQQMPAVTDLGVPMSREGSGTAWLPDSTTIFGKMYQHGDDMFMTHGVGVLRYSDTLTDRGSRTFNAPDWYMLMDSHPLSRYAQFGARAMITSDFATVGGYGYPILFQTGESYHGQALHDRQHPHDLFSELAGTFSFLTSAHSTANLYVGYPGEPALGPPTYMHRAVAYDMADSPIGHHWEDATHITFGVVTTGFSSNNVKLELSSFTGREPNEIRTNFDPVHLNSASSRLSWNATKNLATQVSYGYIKSPEALTPHVDQHRSTASIVYDNPLGPGEFLTGSLVWGQNLESTGGARSNAYLLEGDYHRNGNSVYSRIEFVQKSGAELVLNDPIVADTLFPISAFTVGYVHDCQLTGSLTVVGLGGQVTVNTRPGLLTPYDGTAAPLGFEVFLRFRPAAMTGSMGAH